MEPIAVVDWYQSPYIRLGEGIPRLSCKLTSGWVREFPGFHLCCKYITVFRRALTGQLVYLT
jgi:hypothetical protein